MERGTLHFFYIPATIRTPLINEQCQSMSINSDQSRLMQINSIILIGIDRNWALIEGVLYNLIKNVESTRVPVKRVT